MHSNRFVWDFWNVPGQYTHLRTPAWEYFPKKVYDKFHERLVLWGRRTLGCHDVSPPWLSAYVTGCEQEMHGDLPHGPWAFVYSLTNWDKRIFSGGETMILKDEVLDYWSDFTSERSIERDQVLDLIEPKFNRLIAFDPRVPHGVRRVDGTMDPAKGRLVIHGWFVQPRPFIEGPLPIVALTEPFDQVTAVVAPHLEAGLTITGLLSLRFTVSKLGAVSTVKLLSDTTRTNALSEKTRKKLIRDLEGTVRTLKFPKARAESHITLPLVFER